MKIEEAPGLNFVFVSGVLHPLRIGEGRRFKVQLLDKDGAPAAGSAKAEARGLLEEQAGPLEEHGG